MVGKGNSLYKWQIVDIYVRFLGCTILSSHLTKPHWKKMFFSFLETIVLST